MKRIPLYLITGFLGSGKTTLIKNLLDEYSGNQKIAIVQNEFADVNIDGNELLATGKPFDLLEINNGSVFCVCLLGSFVKSLASFIREHQPDLVLLEASGLSDPIAVSQILASKELNSLGWLARTITLIDVIHFDKTVATVQRTRHQIQIADTVLLNKTDLIGQPGCCSASQADTKDTSLTETIQKDNRLGKIEQTIRQMNPFAEILPVSFARKNGLLRPAFSLNNKILSENTSEGPPDVDVVVVRSQRIIGHSSLLQFLDDYIPFVYRIKGFVLTNQGITAVQGSYQLLEYHQVTNGDRGTELVLIGQGLHQQSVQNAFDRLTIGQSLVDNPT